MRGAGCDAQTVVIWGVFLGASLFGPLAGRPRQLLPEREPLDLAGGGSKMTNARVPLRLDLAAAKDYHGRDWTTLETDAQPLGGQQPWPLGARERQRSLRLGQGHGHGVTRHCRLIWASLARQGLARSRLGGGTREMATEALLMVMHGEYQWSIL